ncbi:MAG: isocitrate lyase/PEP mutase family protein [Spirochaetales bacterium]|nr:isocitrate lyase/PEP mutase family protein [Spirochaetales bacterium]
MPAAKSFFQLIRERNEILWAPCVYDCISARVAEAIGFEAVTISSSEQRDSLTGGRMRGLISMDEMLYSAERIAKSTSMAVFADTEAGGATPMDTYKNIKRFAEAGIMAVNIEDEAIVHLGKTVIDDQCFLSAEQWAMHVQAAVEAVKGTECMVIARTNCKGGGAKKFNNGYFAITADRMLGLDEAIRRAQLGIKVGAHMTMIQSINAYTERESWKKIHDLVPGWMCYPDIHADDGISDVEDVDELYKMGFQLITCHCLSKGAISGMMKYGTKLMKDRNTVFSENDDYLGADKELLAKYRSLGTGKDYKEVEAKLEKNFPNVCNYKLSLEKVR